MKSIVILTTLTVLLGVRGQLPARWWEQNKAHNIASESEYNAMLEGELKDKFVFIDFYMQQCKWCYYIVEDFNKLINDMEVWYTPSKVAFLKIDGQLIPELAYRYQVMYFPHFIAIAPQTKGQEASVFRNPMRTYDSLKEWMLEVMGDTPMSEAYLQDEHVATEIESKTIKKVHDEIQQVLTDLKVRQSDTQDVAFIDVLNVVSENTIRESRKLRSISKTLEQVKLSQTEHVTESVDSELSAFSVFLLGLLAGAFTSVGLVIYVNLNKGSSKQKTGVKKEGPGESKSAQHQKLKPGRAHRSVDEEKVA